MESLLLQFERKAVMNFEGYVLPTSAVTYSPLETPHTRVVEYKFLLHQTSQHTVWFIEYLIEDVQPFCPMKGEQLKKFVVYDAEPRKLLM